jgi:hypothetical protein
MRMKQKISFFLEFFFQNGRLKKTEIFKTASSQICSRKFHGLVLGLVVLIDANGIDVAQPIWS